MIERRAILALGAVALVVALNQTSGGGSPAPTVLGVKLARCSGVRRIHAEPLNVTVTRGKPSAVLGPAIRITPGATPEAVEPVTLSVGSRGAAAGRVALQIAVENTGDCDVAVSLGRVTASHGDSPATVAAIRFGSRDRVLVPAGKRAVGRAEVPVDSDGTWRVESSAYTEIGASG